MNALRLALDLEVNSSQMEYGYATSDWKLLSDSATMLRKQHAEIEALKEQLINTKADHSYWMARASEFELKYEPPEGEL